MGTRTQMIDEEKQKKLLSRCQIVIFLGS